VPVRISGRGILEIEESLPFGIGGAIPTGP